MKKFRLVKEFNANRESWDYFIEEKDGWWPATWRCMYSSRTEDEKKAQAAYIVCLANKGTKVVLAGPN
jgi:hypothetical protein